MASPSQQLLQDEVEVEENDGDDGDGEEMDVYNFDDEGMVL